MILGMGRIIGRGGRGRVWRSFSTQPEVQYVDAEDYFDFEGNSFFTSVNGRGQILIQGRDAEKFLQGLTTNDIRLLQNSSSSFSLPSSSPSSSPFTSSSSPVGLPGPCMPSLLLNTQGRVFVDTLLYKIGEDAYVMEGDWDEIDGVIKYLKKFKLRSKVKIEDVSENYTSWAVVAHPEEEKDIINHLSSIQGAYFSHDPRTPKLGFRGLLNSDYLDDFQTPELFEKCHPVDPSYYDVWRRICGVPEGPVDVPIDQLTPLECNFDILNHISFTKGCYVGQELTARTHYTGKIRKRLLPCLIFPEDDLPPVEEITKFSELLTKGPINAVEALSSPLLDPSFEIEGVEDKKEKKGEGEGEGEREGERGGEGGEESELEIDDTVVGHRKEIRVNGKRGGMLYSSVFNVGLAMVRMEHLKNSSSSFSVGPYRLFPFLPSFLRKEN